MKTFILVLLIAASASAEPMHDGTYWQELNPPEKEKWATGWMDGLCTGLLISVNPDAYKARVHALGGLTAAEVCKGLTQLYEADYRNLRIGMQEGALFVARFSRDGMSSRDAAAQLIALREKYKGAR